MRSNYGAATIVNSLNSRERLRVLPASSKAGYEFGVHHVPTAPALNFLEFPLNFQRFLGCIYTHCICRLDRILLDLSNDHVVLIQGDSANVTLTIENNDTSIHDFSLSTDAYFDLIRLECHFG